MNRLHYCCSCSTFFVGTARQEATADRKSKKNCYYFVVDNQQNQVCLSCSREVMDACESKFCLSLLKIV